MSKRKPSLPKSAAIGQRYGWNLRIGKNGGYYDFKTHRIVSNDSVEKAIDEYVKNTKAVMEGYTSSLKEGSITVQQWRRLMQEEIRDIHRNLAAVYGGGWKNMTPSDWGKVGAELKAQYKYLDKFATAIARGNQPLNGRALRRVEMYADAARSTGQELARDRAGKAGRTQERRMLGPAEHCQDCLIAASRGWQKLGTLPKIGESRCLVNCKCYFVYR